MKRSSFWKIACLIALLPFLYLGTASATYFYQYHKLGDERGLSIPAPFPALHKGQSIIIFAPHCDDETLGCAGLMQQAVKLGIPVSVVIITNGDGFRVGVEREFRKLHVHRQDFIRFAAIRQHESLTALESLGIQPQNILFLGYPDQGLWAIWNSHWSNSNPFTSPYTKSDRCPYPVAFEDNVPYSGASVLSEIKKVLRDKRPTDVFVTHPSDDHPDHAAAAAFVSLALQQLAKDSSYFKNTKLYYYLIHRGDWPLPQGLRPNHYLLPPVEMDNLDTHWTMLPLSEREIIKKRQAIADYRSQTTMMARFLYSFDRRNELFGTLSPKTAFQFHGTDNPVLREVSTQTWQDIKPVVLDPVNDTLIRDFQPNGDLKSVYAATDRKNLYLCVDTAAAITKGTRFHLFIRYFGSARRLTSGGTLNLYINPPHACRPAGYVCDTNKNRLEVTIPLSHIGYAREISLSVDTSTAGIHIDTIGVRFIYLSRSPHHLSSQIAQLH